MAPHVTQTTVARELQLPQILDSLNGPSSDSLQSLFPALSVLEVRLKTGHFDIRSFPGWTIPSYVLLRGRQQGGSDARVQ